MVLTPCYAVSIAKTISTTRDIHYRAWTMPTHLHVCGQVLPDPTLRMMLPRLLPVMAIAAMGGALFGYDLGEHH